MKRTSSRRIFGSVYSLVPFFALAISLGCVDASLDPDRVSARIVAAGEYAVNKGVPALIESRTKIPCELGRLFGVDYELEVIGGGPGLVPVEFGWLHPAIPVEGSDRTGTATRGGVSNLMMERGDDTLLGRSLWSIDRADERVSGVYRFEIRTTGDRRLVLSQDFEIEGC